jgi:hypothetical protein
VWTVRKAGAGGLPDVRAEIVDGPNASRSAFSDNGGSYCLKGFGS